MSNVLNSVKNFAVKVYQTGPFAVGVIAGYVFKPELKFAVDAAVALVKNLLKL